jgi:MraZ protein
MLLGKYVLPIGTDGWFTLPLDYRQGLSKALYLTQGLDHNLLLLTKNAFEKLYSHVKSVSITDPAARLLTRLILGNTVVLGINPAGMIQVPATLYEYAGFEGEVVLVGQGDYLELWSPITWDKLSDILRDYNQNVQRFEKFNVPLT